MVKWIHMGVLKHVHQSKAPWLLINPNLIPLKWGLFWILGEYCKLLGRVTILVLCRQNPLNLHQFHLTRDSKYGLVGTDRNAICLYFASIRLYLVCCLLCQSEKSWQLWIEITRPFGKHLYSSEMDPCNFIICTNKQERF